MAPTDALKKLDFTKFSTREQILTVLTLVAVLWAYMGFLMMPMIRDVKALTIQKASLKAETDQAMALIPVRQQRLQELRQSAQSKEVSQEFSAKVGDLFPGGSRLSSVLEELTRLARMRQIEFVSVRPDSIEDKGTYLQLTLQIDVKSRFRELGDYLLMLENLPRVVVVKDLKIETQPGISPSILAHLKTVTYLGKE